MQGKGEWFLLLLIGGKTPCMPIRNYPYVSFHFLNKLYFPVFLHIFHNGVPSRYLRSPAVASSRTQARGLCGPPDTGEKEMVRAAFCSTPAIPKCLVKNLPRFTKHLAWVGISLETGAEAASCSWDEAQMTMRKTGHLCWHLGPLGQNTVSACEQVGSG